MTIITAAHPLKIDYVVNVLEFLGTPAAARVCKRWDQNQRVANRHVFQACRKEMLLQAFLLRPVTIRELHEEVVRLGNRVGLSLDRKAPLLHSVKIIHDCTTSTNTVINVIKTKTPHIQWSNAVIPIDRAADDLQTIRHHRYTVTFSQITELDLSHKNLTHVPIELSFFYHLERVNLSHNQLTAIPEDLLERSPNRQINVAHNQIRTYPLLPWVNLVEDLNLQNNPLQPVISESSLQARSKALKIHAVFAFVITVLIAVLCVYLGVPWIESTVLCVLLNGVPLAVHAFLNWRDRHFAECKMAKHFQQGAQA